MAERSLALARTAAQRRLLAAVGATVLLLVLALSFALGWLTDATRTAVAAAVDAAAPSDRQTVLTIPVAGDPAAQGAQAEALLHGLFGDSLRIDADLASPGGTSRWTLTVDPQRFDPWRIAWIAADLDDLGVLAQQQDGLAPEGASTDGGLAGTLDATTGEVLAVAVVVPVPLALIAIGGIIAVLQLARLLGGARATETSILRARGLGPRDARRFARGEALVVAGGGALVGWLAAAGLVAVTGGDLLMALRTTWPVPLLAVIGLGMLIASAQLRAAEQGGSDRSGRARAAVTGLGAGIVVLAAAVFVWQLLGLEGDAAELTASTWSLVVLAVAPALGLAAIATLALLLFGPAASAVARAGVRRPGLSPALPARMVARHIAIFGVVVALLALAAGGAAFGGTVIATWQRAADQTAVLAAGAGARAVLADGAVPADAVEAAASAGGVTAAASAIVDAADAGGAGLQVVALPDSAVADLVTPLPAAQVDPQRLTAAIAVDTPAGEPLGAGAAGIRMTFALTAGGGSRPTIPAASMLGGQAWFVDALGTPVRVPLDLAVTPDPSTHTLAPMFSGCTDPECPFEDHWSAGTLTADAPLPEGDDWSLVGFTIGFPNSPGSQSPGLLPLELTTTSGTPLPWPSEAPIVLNAEHPSAAVTVAAPQAVPAAVTEELAKALDLTVGDGFELTLDRSRRTLPVRISDIVRVIPGTTSAAAALVPLDQATLVMLARTGDAVSPGELWASGADAGTAVRAALPTAAVVDAVRPGTFSDALVLPWWLATVATALLAGVALVAAAVGLAQQRATDVFVLRGLGLSARRQSASRTGELVVVGVAAAIAGAALGFALAVLCAPVLTRAAVADVPAIIAGDVVPGFVPLAVAIVLAALAIVAASLVVGRLVARQALAGRVREAP